MDNAIHDLAGTDLDGLRIIEKLGSGGMGDVWLGHDEDLDIPIAVKVLKPEFAADQNFLVRFLREARAVAKLKHDNIVGVMQAGRRSWHGGNLRIMVLEYVEGQDAHEELKANRKGKLKPKRAAEIILGAAQALKYAHGKGVIHRDIKPANILCGKDGAIKVLDFGLAKLLGGSTPPSTDSPVHSTGATGNEGSSSTNAILGTPHYMPPEQAQGRPADGRADIYSLGITLYHLLTGVLPFDGDNAFSIISGHVREELPLKEELFGDLPPVFMELISGMCEKSPDDRMPLKLVIDRLSEVLFPTALRSGDRASDSQSLEGPEGKSDHPSRLSLRSTSGQSDLEPERKTNLIPRETSFVGREAEIEAIAKIFDDSRLVTIMGPGGVGKTRITQEYGLSVIEDFDGGVYFCDLTEARTPDGIAADVGKGLGIPLTQKDGIEQIHASLRYRQGKILMILDNFEQVTQHAAETLGVWMRDTPHVKFLASSREPLHLEGEHSFPLNPLSSEEIDEGVDPPNATKLFADRAAMAKRGFALTDDNRQAIAEICKQLDGIPLAIELAAARCSALSPQKILERLPRRFDLLKSRRQDQSQRQLTLRGAIDWSWNLLTPWEQSALAQCSVFQGGFFLEAAEAVIDLEAFPDAPFEIDVVEALVEKSLLTAYEVKGLAGETRYRMLESVRQYSEEKLMELSPTAPRSGDRASDSQSLEGPEGQSDHPSRLDAAHRPQGNRIESDPTETLLLRHANHYLDYAERWDEAVHGPKIVEALDRIELELENLFGIQAALENSQPELVGRVVMAASSTIRIRGPRRERIPRLERALGLLREPSSNLLKVSIAEALATAHIECGTLEGTSLAGRIAVQSAKEVPPEEQLLATALSGLAQYSALHRSDITLAAKALDGCLAILGLRAENLRQGVGSFDRKLKRASIGLIVNRGILHWRTGEFEIATMCFEEAEMLFRESADLNRVALIVGNRGIILRSKGDIDGALLCYREAESLYRRIGNKEGISRVLVNRGVALRDANEHEGALSCYGESESICRAVGDQVGLTFILGNIGVVHMSDGQFDRALALLSEADAIFDAIGDGHEKARNTVNIGICLTLMGHYEQAWAALDEAESLSREVNSDSQLAFSLLGKSRALLAENRDMPLALKLVQECLDIQRKMGIETTKPFFQSLAVLAAVHWRLGVSTDHPSRLDASHQPQGNRSIEAGATSEETHREKAIKYALQAKALGEELELPRLIDAPHPKAGEVDEFWAYVDEVLGN